MEALAIYSRQEIAQAQEVQEITTALFNDFVAYIDRGERTTRTYLTNLRQFMAWLRFTATPRPQRKDIISYRDWLTVEHEAISFAPDAVSGWEYRLDHSGNHQRITCKPTTVKGYLQAVKAFFGWTAANGLYPDIARNIHAPKITESHKKDSLTASEVLTVESSIVDRAQDRAQAAAEAAKDKTGRVQRSTEQGARLYAMYLLAVNAGLRTVEISRANIKDLETKGGRTWLYVWGKGHSCADQRKPLAPEVKAAIDAYLKTRTDNPTSNSPLFVSTGNRSHGKRIATTTISTMLKGALKGAGFNSERLTAHSLRHSTAQNVMEITGNNIYTAQQYLRHSSPKTTEIYLENNSVEQDERIAQKLYRHFHGASEQESSREQLETIVAMMSPEKLEQLLAVAKVMG